MSVPTVCLLLIPSKILASINLYCIQTSPNNRTFRTSNRTSYRALREQGRNFLYEAILLLVCLHGLLVDWVAFSSCRASDDGCEIVPELKCRRGLGTGINGRLSRLFDDRSIV